MWINFRQLAAEKKRRLLFPESLDVRILSAAAFLAGQGIARPILVGENEAIKAAAERENISLESIEILAPEGDSRFQVYAEELYERLKSKGLSLAAAQDRLKDPLYFSCMTLKDARADGMVCGAVRTSGDTVRAGFTCLGLAPQMRTAFGVFIMECPNASGGNRTLMFADSAVSPHPSPRALAAIGVGASKVFESLLGERARVAFMSFSTLGSAQDESVSAVQKAVSLIREKAPDLLVEGEIQGDAALNGDIAQQKGVSSESVAGQANVLIFPDLNAGNIAYKLVQYLGGARAVGPLIMGLSSPFSDLSRGCTDEDIVDAAALVSLF